MTRIVRTCHVCGNVSDKTYRCDDREHCGKDLVDAPTHVRIHEWPSIGGAREDGFVEVEFPIKCLGCSSTRWIQLSYSDIGRVIRIGCRHCESLEKHRPVGQDVYRPYTALLDDETPSTPSIGSS